MIWVDHEAQELQKALEKKRVRESLVQKARQDCQFRNCVRNGRVNLQNDSYYNSFMNDVIRNIESGEMEYVFHDYHLRDIFCLHPEAEVIVEDFYYAVYLPNKFLNKTRRIKSDV